MSRVQLALNVDDLDEAIIFYSKLFDTTPAKLKEGYANFAVTEPPLKLVLLQNPGEGGTINHLGVEVESRDTVHAEIARLTGEGLVTEEQLGTTCCFATQDKVWVTGPAGEKWEVYTVLADSDTFAPARNTSTKTTPRAASAAVAPSGPTTRHSPLSRGHAASRRSIEGWTLKSGSWRAAPACRSYGNGCGMPPMPWVAPQSMFGSDGSHRRRG